MEALVQLTDALIAQWIEHSTPTRKVAGSTPVERTINYQMPQGIFYYVCFSVILVLKMKENRLFKTMYIIGEIFVAYGLLMLMAMGFLYFFNYFFLVWGIVLMLTAFYHKQIYEKLGKKMYQVLRIITYICLSVFLLFEVTAIIYGFSKPKKDASIVIVLGSGVNEDMSLSKDFKGRLDAGLKYYEDNKDAIIVVTGKQGRGEPIAEAVVARRYLLENGVPDSHIRVDDKSKNTHENIQNAYDLVTDIKDKKTVIVSSCFHLFRANFIAHKIGFEDVSLMASAGDIIIIPHYYAREFFAFIKDFIVLNHLA